MFDSFFIRLAWQLNKANTLVYGEQDVGLSILGQEVELANDTAIVPRSSHRWHVTVIAKKTSG
jgi:hypothetical protein